VAPIDDQGDLLVEQFERLLSSQTKIVAITHMSNVLGTVTPVLDLVSKAHAVGAKVLVDGAQAVAHMPVDVQQLGCDFYAFSGHKLYGPTGVGVLYGKHELLDAMPPYQTGGGMVDQVAFQGTSYLAAPLRFEAGTPDIAGAVGLSAAMDYLSSLGLSAVSQHERQLTDYAAAALSEVPDLRLIGTSARRTSVISFALGEIHPQDVGTILDNQGVAIRAGHHCAQPLMQRFGVPATARASLGVYNNRDDVDALVKGIHKVLELFR
jgi:cysteine desulfurase/selenocysteine lyase